MSITKSYAQNEFDVLKFTAPDAIVLEFEKEILYLVDKFNNSGQSGGSAHFVATIISNVIKKLCLQQPISPITNNIDDWMSLSDLGDNEMSQHKRNGAVFKYKEEYCYYLDAIIKKTPNGNCWSGSLYLTKEDALNNTNRIETKIKSFPFEPKTFYIDVLEEEVSKDDWIMWVKEPKQLEEVFNYYDKI